jgi:hypothetical protein
VDKLRGVCIVRKISQEASQELAKFKVTRSLIALARASWIWIDHERSTLL